MLLLVALVNIFCFKISYWLERIVDKIVSTIRREGDYGSVEHIKSRYIPSRKLVRSQLGGYEDQQRYEITDNLVYFTGKVFEYPLDYFC